MTLNVLIHTLGKENADELDGRPVTAYGYHKEVSDFVWGVVYSTQLTRYSKSAPNNIKVELVYRGRKSGEVYLASPTIHQIGLGADFDAPFYGVTDVRALLFDTKEHYLKFLQILHEHRQKGRISDELYMGALDAVKNTVNMIYPKAYAKARNRLSFWFSSINDEVVKELRTMLDNDPLLCLIW